MRISTRNLTSLRWCNWLGAALLTVLLLIFLFPINTRAADEAESLFKAKCATCHAADGSGNTPIGRSMKAPDLGSQDVQKESDDKLAEVIQKGKGKMPAVKNLTADQVKQLVALVRGLAKK